MLSTSPFGDGGDGSRKTSFPPCRRHHPQRHALHDDNSRHGSKSGLWPFKKAAFGGRKTAACVIPTIWRLQIDNKVIFFVPAQPDFFYRQRRTFCICGFSACHQAGAAGGGGEYPRARSRDSARHAQTHRAKP